MVTIGHLAYIPRDIVDLRIMNRDTVVRGPAWNNTYQRCINEADIPSDYDPDGRGWLERGIQPAQNVVASNPEIGVYEPIGTSLRAANSVVNVPWNLTGKYFSHNRNWEERIRSALFDRKGGTNQDTRDLATLVEKEGYDTPMKVVGIGVENMEDAGAKIVYDGKESYIIAHRDIARLARELAAKYGARSKDAEVELVEHLIINFAYHEAIVHNLGVKSERKVGEVLAKFWKGKAKLSSGERASMYKALAAYNEEYAQGFSFFGELVQKYLDEAAERGYEGKTAKEYVARKLEEQSPKGKSGLEKRAEKGGKKDSSKGGKESREQTKGRGSDKEDTKEGDSSEESEEESSEGGSSD